MFVFFFFACIFGTSEEAPDPTPPAPEEPVAEEPVAEEPTPEPTAPEPVEVVVDAELTALTDEAVSRSVAEAMALYSTASTSTELEAAYTKAIVAADALTAWAEERAVPDFDPILAKAPGLGMGWFAEGTIAVFYLDPEQWQAKAAATPQADDDAFFALTSQAYSQANPGGYAAWEVRTWDYGGCSALGEGVLLETLALAQQADEAGPAFTAPTASVRDAAIEHITRDNTTGFQLCDYRTNGPRDDDAMKGEVQQILDTVTLSDTHREALTTVQPGLKGEAFSGG